jgi:hypothetical protein
MKVFTNNLYADFQFIPSFRFSRINILFAQNGKKMKRVVMLFTQIRLRIAQKIDIQVQFLVYFYVILCKLYHFSVPLDTLKIFKLLFLDL